MSARLERLQRAAQAADLDAIVVVPGANLRYLLGLDFHLSERLTVAVVPAAGEVSFVLPQMESRRAHEQSGVALRLYPWADEDGPYAALTSCARDLGLAGRRIGVEFTGMRVLELRGLELVAPGLTVVDATPVLMALRQVKDAQELALMREAVRIVEHGLHATIAAIRPGVSERELAEVWERTMAAAGGEGPSFATLIASGPNSANPHHAAGDRRVQPGDLIILDGGARYRGYISDITRTVALGEPGPEARAIYALVARANAAGRAAARAGVSGETIDTAARAVIAAGGYGPQFLHRTGHGIGLETHEPPYIVRGNTQPLPAGATFTIEPGVYVPNLGGVRIEDDVLLSVEGCESLTSFPRELIVIPIDDHT